MSVSLCPCQKVCRNFVFHQPSQPLSRSASSDRRTHTYTHKHINQGTLLEKFSATSSHISLHRPIDTSCQYFVPYPLLLLLQDHLLQWNYKRHLKDKNRLKKPAYKWLKALWVWVRTNWIKLKRECCSVSSRSHVKVKDMHNGAQWIKGQGKYTSQIQRVSIKTASTSDTALKQTEWY